MPADSEACCRIFLESVADLSARLGSPWEMNPDQAWQRLEGLYAMLADHAAEWWVAEEAASGELVAYARSIERGTLFELSEFFVRPARQSAGIGRQLLERAFPPGRGEQRIIIATTDVRAQARYYAAGTVARFPIMALGTAPRETEAPPGLGVRRATEAEIGALQALERAVIGHDRGDEFAWLLGEREGYLYEADGRTIGYGFVGERRSGPVAALEPDAQAAILLHLEGRARQLGCEELSFEVPAINAVAMRHLLSRGFRLETFYTFLMSSRPVDGFDRFIGMAPPFVL